jgi:hypothetical protein
MSVIRATAALLGVLLCVVPPAHSASPVNFSGTWELDRSRSVLPSIGPSALPGDVTLIIDQQGETLKIERRASLMGLHRTLTSTYYTDGREASNLTPRGETVISRSHWEGTSLVTVHKGTVTLEGKVQRVEITDVKRLSEDGKELIVDSTIQLAGEDAPERSHVIFVRK